MTIQDDAAIVRHNGATQAAPVASSMGSFIAQGAAFMQLAVDMSKSDIIPKAFINKPANVFLAIEMAHRLGLGTMEVMQNLYVVHGTPSLSSKFLIGLANRSGRFRGGLRFDATQDGVRCYATDRETSEVLEVTVTMAQAKRAGWTKNAKYNEMGEQMLSYRAATFFVRRYCPEVMLGMMTVEEANELPRSVPLESSDPLDAALAPLDAPDETGKAIIDAVHSEPEYAPEAMVEEMLAAFEAIGKTREEVDAAFGPLDKMGSQTLAECREWFKAERKKFQAKGAAPEPEPGSAQAQPTLIDNEPDRPYDPDTEPF